MLPKEFLTRMQSLLGEEFPAFELSFEREPYKALRVNTEKITVEDFLRISPFALRRVPWTENGFYYEVGDQPGRHPFHEAGLYYIQEPSAMAPAPFLEVKEGERVLDLCAAPGGKTTQLAAGMKGEGLLISNEIHPARARILSENVERMGLVNTIVTNESPEKLAKVVPGYFDKILVDAPCSGEGMFRKNEEAAGEWSPENVTLCSRRQDQILEEAAKMLRPGGRLVYSTCTFAPEEDEGSISRFLHEHPEFSVQYVKKPEGFQAGRPDWIMHPVPGLEDTMRLMPHKIEGEGHYLAILQKESGPGGSFLCTAAGGEEKGLSEKEYRDFTLFCEENLREFPFRGIYLRFGEQLYLGPAGMPALKGLKVLRPGLHLGTFKKNRFEPSHALALALRPTQVRRYINLSAEGNEAARFLSGQTLTYKDGEKGWCLVCVEGCSLGWGKLTAGILKNHYPKGLRKG
ncbi:MAG: RsmB/NOP family class I SAM-dependent RNA methyltransferase [Lachnospiraceae bacterium]|nr:RsmB/NOP family class I SAM-dependent RNA methyltransferase [Lachnospiraceae bacterium]